MNINSIQVSTQWSEIQRAAQEKTQLRQNLLAKQYNVQTQTASADSSLNNSGDQHREQRTVFTKSGRLEQSYIPKGTLFDKVG